MYNPNPYPAWQLNFLYGSPRLQSQRERERGRKGEKEREREREREKEVETVSSFLISLDI